MNFQQANETLTGRNSQRKKVANNTYLERHDSHIAVRLHNTDIVELYPDGEVILNSGGWLTLTTKDRLNSSAPDTVDAHVRISQENKQWFVYFIPEKYDWEHATRYHWQEGFKYNTETGQVFDGVIYDAKKIKAQKKLQRKISSYVDRYMTALDAGKVSAPGLGDCFYCSMREARGDIKTGVLNPNGHVENEHTVGFGINGKTLGELNNSIDHLDSHIQENYFVPSLMARAIEIFPVSQAAKWYVGSYWDTTVDLQTRNTARSAGRICADQLKRALRRYIERQYGFGS